MPQIATCQEVRQGCKEDLNLFAALLMAEGYEVPFPSVLQVVWEELRKGVEASFGNMYKLAIGLPRGHAKTTLIKLWVVWAILYTKKSFFLIISATEDLAEDVLNDIWEFILSENFKAVYGDVTGTVERNRVDMKIFEYEGREIILRAKGAGSSLRGINIKNKRPDVIIMEDMQTRENAKSEVDSKNLTEWMLGTLMKTKSPKGCLYVFIGNMYPYDGSILKKLKRDDSWVSFVVGAILADGSALWPELHSKEMLMAEFEGDAKLGHPEIFFAEVLNDEEAGINTDIDLSSIPPYPYELEDELNLLAPQAKYIIIDPATQNAKTTDTTVIGLFLVVDGKPIYRRVLEGKWSGIDTIKKSLELALEWGVRLIVVENVAYQAELLNWFQITADRLGITSIDFLPINPKGVSKNARILNFFKELMAGEVLLHPEVRTKVMMEIGRFDKLRNNNKDDVIDVGAYATRVFNMYGDSAVSDVEAVIEELNEPPVLEFNSLF